MLGQTSHPCVGIQQFGPGGCWSDFPSLCWDWNNGKTPCQTSPPCVGIQQFGPGGCWSDFPSLCWDWNPIVGIGIFVKHRVRFPFLLAEFNNLASCDVGVTSLPIVGIGILVNHHVKITY